MLSCFREGSRSLEMLVSGNAVGRHSPHFEVSPAAIALTNRVSGSRSLPAVSGGSRKMHRALHVWLPRKRSKGHPINRESHSREQHQDPEVLQVGIHWKMKELNPVDDKLDFAAQADHIELDLARGVG